MSNFTIETTATSVHLAFDGEHIALIEIIPTAERDGRNTLKATGRTGLGLEVIARGESFDDLLRNAESQSILQG